MRLSQDSKSTCQQVMEPRDLTFGSRDITGSVTNEYQAGFKEGHGYETREMVLNVESVHIDTLTIKEDCFLYFLPPFNVFHLPQRPSRPKSSSITVEKNLYNIKINYSVFTFCTVIFVLKFHIAADYNIVASTVYQLVRTKPDSLSKHREENPHSPWRNVFKGSDFPEIDHALNIWFYQERSKNTFLNQTILSEKSIKDLGLKLNDIELSNWLNNDSNCSGYNLMSDDEIVESANNLANSNGDDQDSSDESDMEAVQHQSKQPRVSNTTASMACDDLINFCLDHDIDTTPFTSLKKFALKNKELSVKQSSLSRFFKPKSPAKTSGPQTCNPQNISSISIKI
ncbi:hypothetical protein BpHYR1_004987 [Brachionus plicatilis]|uniref:Uncharacterized protein n=1 Tax=Brachionus plicatilis TaxID=10195 RepID=A0A3M7S2R8_BRAPC|nr:hypothetical protein BpHYR1_004987 [Brachionus plicatilis]